jgi:hypothetical protein
MTRPWSAQTFTRRSAVDFLSLPYRLVLSPREMLSLYRCL